MLNSLSSTPDLSIRALKVSDLPLVHQWNEANIPHVNSLDFDSFEQVFKLSTFAYLLTIDHTPAGFAWLMGPNLSYSSSNYRYFNSNLNTFLYLDRIIIAESSRGRGLATYLYQYIASEHPNVPICCEVNSKPPNIASTRLHEKLGFKEVGQQMTEGGKKQVRLLVWNPT